MLAVPLVLDPRLAREQVAELHCRGQKVRGQRLPGVAAVDRLERAVDGSRVPEQHIASLQRRRADLRSMRIDVLTYPSQPLRVRYLHLRVMQDQPMRPG